MRNKLTIILFSLLLAVGWTNVAQAQSMTRAKVGVKAPLRADRAYTDMVTITAEKAKTMEYSWTDAEGSHISKATDVATKPEQIYELLRYVYTNKEFPGPSYSAWDAEDLALSSFPNRVDEVYYGGIGGGWDIGASYTAVPNNNITITISDGTVNFDYIELIGDGVVIDRWDYTDGTNWPTGWSCSGTLKTSTNGFCYLYYSNYSNGGTITINSNRFSSGNYRSVRVVVHACDDADASGYITCAGFSQTPKTPSEVKSYENLETTPTIKQALRDYTWTITGTETLVADGTYTPNEEGYTALVVSVKNDADIYDEPISYLGSCSFYTKKEVIDWIGKTIDQVKLLTDGLLIGVQGDYTRGTVFNCDGRYNKFFFLSKGQARKKSSQVETWISNGSRPKYIGEEVAFKRMFEEFSPTTGGEGDEITNFYSKMKEGSVYDIVHDCASVIQNGHQFSMSGNAGETYYALSGLNFFIPDYRLALWWNPYTINGSERQYVDGRSFVPYEYYNNNGYLQTYANGAGVWSAKYAQYNPKYAPKVGVYKITLHAEAEPVAYVYEPDNRNYKVTLTWVSSLNEMSGHNVPQTYTVYYYDENGKRQKLVVEGYTNTDGQTGLTTLVYYVEQKEHSYTIEYIVMGTPNDTDHPEFIAWSNDDNVTIPGYDDFLVLKLDHHESDFIVRNNGTDKANWYRNFLWVDNDVFNGLSLTEVSKQNGMKSFNLYRWDNTDLSEKKIAVLTFDNPTETQVHYTVSYSDNSSVAGLTAQQRWEPEGNANKYKRSEMEIPDEGYVRVRGNGDLVIQPNGFAANFKSITVKNGSSTIASWNSTDQNAGNLESYGWFLSPGSMWEKLKNAYYLEGGGYIAIPNILNNYNNVTVEIVAFGDGSSVAKVSVDDKPQRLDNDSEAPDTYTWNLSNRGPNRAGEVETVTEDFEDQSMFPPFSTGGINAEIHNGVFGDWKLYDGTGEYVWGFEYIDYTNEGGPHAWFVFNPSVAGDGVDAYSGDQYLEAICPEDNTVAADQWLISPLLSGNEQTITFYERVLSTEYGVGYESYEVMASSTDNEVSSFTRVQNFNSTATSWTKRSVTLPAGTKYFAIHHYSMDVFGVLIDDITYERPVGGVAPTIEGGMLRLGNLPIVDQLKEPIKDDNSHPDTYHYVLKYEPTGGDTKETGTVDVNIQKTEVKVNGNYTVQQINNDQNLDTALLQMDIVSADVTMDLRESDPYIYYYQIQGKHKGDPGEKTDWLTQLQQMDNGRYMEMYEGSKGTPKFEESCDPVIHHYYSSEITGGTYDNNDFFTYAPSVSTWGLKRRYFEVDGDDNTYGGPLWKTGAGKVEIDGKPVLERQVAKDGSVNPYTSWTETVDNGDGTTTTKLYEMYFLGLNAQGYLPKATVSNITYEPYMFRVFVESPSNSLRKYRKVAGQTGDHLVDDGPITGKYCVGSFDVNSHTWGDNLYFQKQIPGKNDANYGNWDANMKFVASRVDDLKIYVRFYYMVSGWNTRDGDGPARPGNGSESGGSSGDITTSVGEINVVSTVVDQIFFNSQGMQSSKPFSGLNIVVTRYSDGSTKTTKMIMK